MKLTSPATAGHHPFHVRSINVSAEKGVKKQPVARASFVAHVGIEGDAHAASGERQLSLLAMESIAKVRALGIDAQPGNFAENITTEGIELHTLSIGTRLTIDNTVLIEITRIGKECHAPCAIARQAGDCVMPREGVFAKILAGGTLEPGALGRVEDSR